MNKLKTGLEGSGKTVYAIRERVEVLKPNERIIYTTRVHSLLLEKYLWFRSEYPNIKAQIYRSTRGEESYESFLNRTRLTEEQGTHFSTDIDVDTQVVFATNTAIHKLRHTSLYIHAKTQQIISNEDFDIIADKLIKEGRPEEIASWSRISAQWNDGEKSAKKHFKTKEIIWDELNLNQMFKKVNISEDETEKVESLKQSIGKLYSTIDKNVIFNGTRQNLHLLQVFCESIPITVCSSELLIKTFFENIDNSIKGRRFFSQPWTVEEYGDKKIEKEFKKKHKIIMFHSDIFTCSAVEFIGKSGEKELLEHRLGIDKLITNKIKGEETHEGVKGSNRFSDDTTLKYGCYINELPFYEYSFLSECFNYVTHKEKVLSVAEIKRITTRDIICQTIGRTIGWRNYWKNKEVVDAKFVVVLSHSLYKLILLSGHDYFPYLVVPETLDLSTVFTKKTYKQLLKYVKDNNEKYNFDQNSYREKKREVELSQRAEKIRAILREHCEVTGNSNDRIEKKDWDKHFEKECKWSWFKLILMETGIKMYANEIKVMGIKFKDAIDKTNNKVESKEGETK
jgi:hypothetical protein